MRPHRRQPTRLPHPWDSPGKNTGVGCPFLLQCMKVKSKSEVAQSCPTLRPHGLQPTRLLRPWDSPGKSTGVGCHRLLRRSRAQPLNGFPGWGGGAGGQEEAQGSPVPESNESEASGKTGPLFLPLQKGKVIKMPPLVPAAESPSVMGRRLAKAQPAPLPSATGSSLSWQPRPLLEGTTL